MLCPLASSLRVTFSKAGKYWKVFSPPFSSSLNSTAAMESVVVPLSFLDAGSSSLSLTFAFILDSPTYDTSKLDEAIHRVCKKWRLVAGRLEFDTKVRSKHLRRCPLRKLTARRRSNGASVSPLRRSCRKAT